MRRADPRPVLLGVALGWETVALVSRGRVPTISEVCRRWRRHPAGVAVIVCLFGLLIHHVLVEEGGHRWQ